jgi:hypothetical protein
VSTAPARYIEPSRRRLRLAALAFAAVLALEALWVLTPEVAHLAGRGRVNACLAARLAIVRGDLWNECALAEQPFRPDLPADVLVRLRGEAERAAFFAPHNGMNWLILANLDSHLDWLTRRAAAALKMSFYTWPNEASLISDRLLVAVRFEALADDEVKLLVRHEVRTIITRRPEFKPSISAAYGDAPPEGKRFLESVIGEVDPNFLPALRSGKERR